jgi:hypothetical protein
MSCAKHLFVTTLCISIVYTEILRIRPENIRSRPKQLEINTRNSITDFFLSVLFIDAVICCGYMASVIDDKTSMDRWWNESDGGKPKC